MDLVKHLAPYFRPYVTLPGKDGNKTYDYLSKGLPGQVKAVCILEFGRKIKGYEDEYLYVATPIQANLADLKPEERLYVGCAQVERMFRGDGLSGTNFNHTAMRRGKKGGRNLNDHLRDGGNLRVHLLGRAAFVRALGEVPEIAWLEPLLRGPTNRKGDLHLGRRLESFILHHDGVPAWAWNSKGPDKVVVDLIEKLRPSASPARLRRP